MNSRLFIAFALLYGIFSQSLLSQETIENKVTDYKSEIEKSRNGTNIKYLYSESSPLTNLQKKDFNGLIYFPVREKYKVEGTLVKSSEQKKIIMKTSTDRAPEYIKYGEVHFIIDSIEQKLSVFQSVKLVNIEGTDNHLFIPFRDETTSLESYGGGRYIDSEIPESGDKIILDFNKAYNPYCAYNHKFSCVIPPDENQLTVKIEAGEKIFEE